MADPYFDLEALSSSVGALHPPGGASARPSFTTVVLDLCDRPRMRVLDAGCGSARLRSTVAGRGYDYVGLDLMSDSADVRGSMTMLPFGDDAFDLIICKSVLQCTLEPLAALREFRRTLAPGGRLLCEVGFLEPWTWGSKLHYTPAGIVLLAREAGFRVDNLWPGWSAAEAFTEAARQLRRPCDSSGLAPLDEFPLMFAASLLLLCS